MGINKISLSNVLFSKVRQKVIGLLYGQPDRDFYTNEIIRITRSGTGAIQRELEKLAAAGLISIKQIGNQKHYHANKAMPLFFELRSIVLKTFGLADVIREGLEQISPNQLYFAFIYGSVAKQNDTANSDIDLMIIGDNLSYAKLFHLLEKSEAKLERKINPTIYSMVDWLKKTNTHFLTQIENQPKIFLIGTENELRALKKPS